MNKIIHFLAIVILISSCTKEEIKMYNLNNDGIQFEYNAQEFKNDFDFSFQYKTVPDEWGYPTEYFFGDSLKEQKIEMIVSLMGWPSEKDRTFKLKALAGDGLSPELVRLEKSYTFQAGKLTDTIEVTLLRPSARGKYKLQLTFDTGHNNSDFTLGADEKLLYTFNITDRYPKPEGWDDRAAWLGEYSEEKYAFIVTELHMVFGYYTDWGYYNQQLRDALNAYNAAHPGNPKNFTFPVNTDSIWWY